MQNYKYGEEMKNRKNYLKAGKKKFRWQQIGMFSDVKCFKCSQNTMIQIYKYDAWACIECNEWYEEVCDSPQCPYCSNRPQTPYEVYWSFDMEKSSTMRRKNWRRSNYQHKMDGEKRHSERRRQYEHF